MEFDVIHEIVENKSRFIGYILRDFTSIDIVKDIAKDLKKEHKKARHVCFAYSCRIDGIENKRYSDDGEPSGTAGIPILSTIESTNTENVLVLVVRYFGGKKLGASKLLRTYRRCARESIELLKKD